MATSGTLLVNVTVRYISPDAETKLGKASCHRPVGPPTLVATGPRGDTCHFRCSTLLQMFANGAQIPTDKVVLLHADVLDTSYVLQACCVILVSDKAFCVYVVTVSVPRSANTPATTFPDFHPQNFDSGRNTTPHPGHGIVERTRKQSVNKRPGPSQRIVPDGNMFYLTLSFLSVNNGTVEKPVQKRGWSPVDWRGLRWLHLPRCSTANKPCGDKNMAARVVWTGASAPAIQCREVGRSGDKLVCQATCAHDESRDWSACRDNDIYMRAHGTQAPPAVKPALPPRRPTSAIVP
ncbi:hypothetical protein Bbelb_225830 [Branchiostoma belcheri]|nr:hypothetical protein Bbelb_225830 [Branchiostoma belcheri]